MDTNKVVIAPVKMIPDEDLRSLITQSEGEGYKFIRRLADEWASGANRFDRNGECLFEARLGDRVIGICGLNIDPFLSDDSIGRLRRLYVVPEHRGQKTGRQLVERVQTAANGRFRQLRARANTNADGFYEKLGFQSVQNDPNCTHVLTLPGP